MKIHFADSSYKIDDAFKQRYIAEVRSAHRDVSKLLPFGSRHINFFIQPREYDLIPETQDNARAYNSEFIELTFNPVADKKGRQVILGNVRASVFHEMNHAARFNIPIYHPRFIDCCIMEGLATVFERDYCASNQPYAKYPENVTNWLEEIIKKQDNISWDAYKFDHPDGRRWIAYKVGTYLIDEAMKNSGKTVIELTQMECADILKLANVSA